MTNERILVLLATFNGASHVEDQIATILTQRGVDVRVIVRDDGSTDDTPSILRRLAAASGGAVSLMEDARGATGSAATNFLAMIAAVEVEGHDWVALADQDDIWMPDKLLRAVHQLRAQNADGYSSNLLAFSDDEASAWIIRKDQPQRRFDHLFQSASAGCTYVLSTRAVHLIARQLAALRKPVPVTISHDWLIYAACRSAGMQWVFDPVARIAYRQHGRNVYGARRGWRALPGKIALMRTHWYRRGIAWLSTFISAGSEEQQVLLHVGRLGWADRWWLIRHAHELRRDRREAQLLRLALLTGLF